jgi:topoisomerase-4 subunit A
MTRIAPLMGQNFIEYASYVIVDRAIPDIRDGLKPVQRRILATLSKMDDGKFHKVANVIGDTMKLHPHGDASIGDALVVLANKDYFIEKQGNFGNPITGHSSAAARYIECRLTDLAKETLFRKALTEFRPSYDGRNEEPVALPAKLPVLLLLGAEGIAVGMSTRILPHNFCELLDAQIKILKNEPFEIYPDFPSGGIIDASEYEDGVGKLKVRARLEKRDKKTIVIREIAFGTTTESLIASIESAAQKGKVKIGTINDFTTDEVEIEVELPRGVYADEVIPQLYAHTDCEVSLTSNMVMIKDRRPVEMGVSEVLCYLTDQLRGLIKAELQH